MKYPIKMNLSIDDAQEAIERWLEDHVLKEYGYTVRQVTFKKNSTSRDEFEILIDPPPKQAEKERVQP